MAQAQPETDPQWWRGAVIYQVYPRSFADGNGDGTGDLAGLRSRLPYLRDLGVDAIWVTPWYVSPLADGGYDVADYRAIDPAFGTLEEAELLIAEALRRWASGRSSTSSRTTSRTSTRGSRPRSPPAPAPPERDRFWFHPGKGEHGEQIPTGWVSDFQGSTWTRTTEPGRHPGRVVPAPVRAAAARPQLVAPRRRRRVRGRPAVLVRPRRRGHPDRLGRAAGQGPDAAGGAGPPRTGRAPARRPRRAARRLPRLARRRRLLRGHARPRRRGLAPGQGPVRAVPAARRDAHRVQLRLHGAAVGRQAAARVDRHHARRARPRRRARHLGAVQPRRHPPGHAVRPRGHVVRVHRQALRHPDRPGRGPAPGAGRGPADGGPARARCTSTRATSWACRRSRTCRWACCRTRCTSAPRASTPAATAAGCRCPGPATAAPYGFGSDGGSWLPQPAGWAEPDRRGAGGRPRPPPCTSTATSWRSAAPSPPWATGR